jgi:hypothetical protein
MKANTWYRATPTYPTPRTVYTEAVIGAANRDGIYMIIENGFCNFYSYQDYSIPSFDDEYLYSCTPATAKRKFNFEAI